MKNQHNNRVRRAGWWLVLACLASATAFAAEPRYEVRLLGNTFTPKAGVSAGAVKQLSDRAGSLQKKGRGSVHALVQLYQVPDDSERADLLRSGLDLGAFVPGNAWIAAIPAGLVKASVSRPEIRWMTPWTADRKLHPRLRAGKVGKSARHPEHPDWIMTMVLLHHDVDLSRGAGLAEAVGGVAMNPVEGIHGLTIWLPESKLAALADEEEVLWIEEGPLPLSPGNNGARSQMKADAMAVSPYDLGGKGVKLFIYDGGRARPTHETFDPGDGSGSRLTTIDTALFDDHATHVAGTAAETERLHRRSRARRGDRRHHLLRRLRADSAAPCCSGTTPATSRPTTPWPADTHDADLGTNSIGSNTASNGYACAREGDYGTRPNLLDGIVRGDNAMVGSPMIMTWANGNEGTAAPCSPAGAAPNFTRPPRRPPAPRTRSTSARVNSDGAAMTGLQQLGSVRRRPPEAGGRRPGCETGRVSGEAAISPRRAPPAPPTASTAAPRWPPRRGRRWSPC